MLIGNRGRFAIELAPVEPSWESHYPPERAGWAGLSIWVEDKNLCAHVRDGEESLRSAFFVPLAPLADWIVRSYSAIALEERASRFPTSAHLHSTVREWGLRPPPEGLGEDEWLDVREAFWDRHFVAAGADGSRLPNVALLRADETLVIAWAPPNFISSPPVTMLHPEGLATVPWPEATAAMARFVDEVADAFARTNVSAPYGWMREPTPRLHLTTDSRLALSLYCARSSSALAALLGVDESQLDDVLGIAAGDEPSASAVCQVVRDLSPHPGAEVGVAVRSTVEAARAASSQQNATWLEGRACALDAARAASTPVEQGYLAAHAVRARLGLDSQPIDSAEAVLRQLGVGVTSSATWSNNERMLVAATQGGAAAATILRTPRTQAPWGTRFEQVRALGHALLDPLRAGSLGAASSRWAQELRRRRSGAFAAELLLPQGALEAASGGSLDGTAAPDVFARLLERYGVGARTAAHHLLNRGWLSSPSVRDELIDLHASHNLDAPG